MSINKDRPHVLILPEDERNRQLADGFYIELQSPRQFRVLGAEKGWPGVKQAFAAVHARLMETYPDRYMILLADGDGDPALLRRRLEEVIPEAVADRVFILGARGEAEDLKRAVPGRYEKIGELLAIECRTGTNQVWNNEQLRHNADELARMQAIKELLFT